MSYFLPGYYNTIWTALKSGLAYTAANLDPSNPAAQKALVGAMSVSLKNGLYAIEANLFFQATQTNFANIVAVPTFSLTIDTATRAFMVNRINAMQAAILSLVNLSTAVVPPQILVQPVTNIPTTLLGGNPIIPNALAPYPDFVVWLLQFSNGGIFFETAPTGLTVSNFSANAQAAATAWVTIANAMVSQGVPYNGANLNAVNQMGFAAQVAASAVANMAALPTGTNLTSAWNSLVAMPTISRYASLVYNDPTSLSSQNINAIRYVILMQILQFNELTIAIRQASVGNVVLATVQQNDSLMDIAARNLGDYEQWYNIAKVNGLLPPFISQSPPLGVTVPGQSQSFITGSPFGAVAYPGEQLFMPTAGSTTAIVGSVPNYLINYLGVDIWYGPINSDMPPWTGDFALIAGYQNLAFSLGRRLQTTLGTLIFHPSFGSRIPPQIGAIETPNEMTLLSAFTESALLSDPRVNKVVRVTTSTLSGSAFAIVINATVLPNSLGSTQVTVNEVLGPA